MRWYCCRLAVDTCPLGLAHPVSVESPWTPLGGVKHDLLGELRDDTLGDLKHDLSVLQKCPARKVLKGPLGCLKKDPLG